VIDCVEIDILKTEQNELDEPISHIFHIEYEESIAKQGL
jgi:hypothetical protein